ncbi:MAG: AAA family ATPase, partial [Fimbriimonadaceae bacterium]|nr:AAA family ATPase [Chitinophagales bacterium]
MKEFKNDVEAIDNLSADYKKLKNEIAKIIVGQDEVVSQVLLCVFSDGHSLLVGVPGLAKT